MKDNFSQQSDLYEKYRPVYPITIYNYLTKLIEKRQNAWDCGTGSGQVALELSKHFEKVFATDISTNQLEQAILMPNIEYSIQSAEKTNFPDNLFDLITVAQAIHWFNFDMFYNEVKRTARDGAVIAVIGYGKASISQELDTLLNYIYSVKLGEYWDPERKFIDQEYRTIPFPFEEILSPQFQIIENWDVTHFIGYLNTWSAVKHFIEKNQDNPIHEAKSEIEALWGEGRRVVTFPLFCRIGIFKS
jgi:cyclopropane fatty-acyl-phospholipid synthase-like methyltransferase